MPAATLTALKPEKQDSPSVPPELVAIKARQQAAWSSGDYAVVGSRHCRLWAKSFARLSIFGQAEKCSTWPPAMEWSA